MSEGAARLVRNRMDLADVLDGLSAADWDAPSLCTGWAVRDVVAHMTLPVRMSTSRFVIEMVKAGGRFNRMADVVARRDGVLPRPELIAALRARPDDPWKPPGAGNTGALTHDVVHGLDITRPLAVERLLPAETVRIVLDALVAPKSRKFFHLALDDRALHATDLDWSWGSGAPLHAPAEDLVLVLAGRTPVAELSR